MQEFTFHYRNFLGGGPPKPPIAGGGHPIPHTPLRRQKIAPPFQNPGYGPGCSNELPEANLLFARTCSDIVAGYSH
ncbi:hypothetical protein DPMN_187370 [Dreissena polymorpha]|uniref:Uncharacterized protein n=1 Tax=Dreissena polymorpha TaxID=45954 RepID=A0A9D4DNW9_DREPO|nr:hypothetical protein DPMN_187370 [Dreissena polymorpha]